MSALVSIGLPVYNGASSLGDALSAIREQTYRDLEIVISDNGSTDATAAICQQHADADGRIRYERQGANRGAAWNFNYVLRAATGDYFMWAAHDDILSPDFVEKTHAVLDGRPDVVLCHSETQPVIAPGDPLGEPYVGFVNDAPSRRDRWNAALRRSELHAAIYGLMRCDAAQRTRGVLACVSADWIFIIEMALQGSITQVPETLQYKRVPPVASDYHTREELLRYMGATSTSGGALLRPSRAQVMYQAISSLGPLGVPARERAVLAMDACRVYATGWAWRADAKEIVRSVLDRRAVARPRATPQKNAP